MAEAYALLGIGGVGGVIVGRLAGALIGIGLACGIILWLGWA